MLNEFLSTLNIKRHLLCHSLAGNKIEYLTITNKLKDNSGIKKQVIFVTSRVHPGETGASWMMHGFIDSLVNPKTKEDESMVESLKDHFEFVIVPMINVDGVINGNYRCSLAACDLNRRWFKPNKQYHPAVYHIKKLC
jgi:murein tripeptide amidase MpaA